MAGKDVPVSPLAPKRQPKVPPIPGVRFATAEAGIRYKGRRTSGSRCSTRARRSPASSPARNVPPPRSTGAARTWAKAPHAPSS